MSVWDHAFKRAEPPKQLTCRTCNQIKESTDFYFSPRDNKHQLDCRLCDAAKRRAKRARNQGKVRK